MIRVLLLWLAMAAPAFAIDPKDMLADPALEARAQALDEELRCVRCRSENIASSNADWARDARLVVRELVSGGASDAEVRAFFVDRYGEVVLMRPTAEGVNLLLWGAGPLMLLLALGLSAAYMRRRARLPEPSEALSDAEKARIDELLDR